MAVSYQLSQLSELAGAEIKGDSQLEITGLASIDTAQRGDLSFIADNTYLDHLQTTQATAVIVSQAHAKSAPKGLTLLLSETPYLAYARVSKLFRRAPPPKPGTHSTAIIAPDAQLGEKCFVGAGAVIEAGASVGDACVIGANAVVGERCVLGDGCELDAGVIILADSHIGRAVRIRAGTVIGSDGFGYAPDNGRWVAIEQCGRVVIEDEVEIGANTTVDCGTLGDTVIGKGVIIDNQVQVAHNVQIGEGTAIAGGVLIAGSVKIGKHCQIGGGTCLNGHIEIADGVILTGMSAVTKSISKKGIYSSVLPVMERQSWNKNAIWFRRLDKVLKNLKLPKDT